MKLMNQEKGNIVGIHTFSTCNVESEEAKSLSRRIELATKAGQNAVAGFVRRIHLALADGDRTEADKARALLANYREMHHMTLMEMYAKLRSVAMVDMLTVKNIIPTVGRTVYAEWTTGNNTHDADIGTNYGALGTDNTTPANGDTTLGTETYRKATSSATNASNVAYLSNFYTATEVTGTFEEAGWFIDGSAAADSGELLSHFLTGSITKSSTETLTVESELTFT